MYKLKKSYLNIILITFIILFVIEFTKYMKMNSNIYGLIYLSINLFMLFLLIPIVYNYKRHYSKARISKIILFILIGIFNCLVLNKIVINNMSIIDESQNYIDSISTIKNIIKPIILFTMILFLIFESKLNIIVRNKYKSAIKSNNI